MTTSGLNKQALNDSVVDEQQVDEQPELNKEIGPNWFASVMGTAIIANAAIGLPIIGEKLATVGFIIWAIACVLLITMLVIASIQTIKNTSIIRRQFNDPVMAQFFGAPPMALLALAGGTLLYGSQIFTDSVTMSIAWTLWISGTLSGVITSVFIPYRLFTRFEVRNDAAFGGWLMPVVPPMVSAAIGAMFIPYLQDNVLQQTMLYGCYAMFGISMMGGMIITTLIWGRLAHSGTSGGARVPTLWIILGPLGQSITAAGALGTVALTVVEQPIAGSLNNMAIIYGVPVWGFAFFWSLIAGLLTLRALRNKMPFALTWWAFTFPVGTCVTGTTQLALHTGLPAFKWAAILLFIGLLCAWLVAAIGTIKGLKAGNIIKNPTKSPVIIAKKG